MSVSVEAVAPRARPLSGGLWTLFSWLRRDESFSSSDSLSSAGSDRTVASFAFLAPAHYPTPTPIVLPPPGPPTDSYKRRVLDRNQRRQRDRDLTLHSKYGLYRSEGGSGYEAFSLPSSRRIIAESGGRQERDRRATSEYSQRRVAHVPGKRRAPPPPERARTAGPSTSLNRRYTRKRPAPQPPVKSRNQSDENIQHLDHVNRNILIQMNSKSSNNMRPSPGNDISPDEKSVKYKKKDGKDVKSRNEKSFLKQIFENRKRNSSIETAPGKVLPSISELDKEAAEIIETCKLKEREQNNNLSEIRNNKIYSQISDGLSTKDTWFCTRCLRKYNASVVKCQYCPPDSKRKSNRVVNENNKNVLSTASNIYTQTDHEFKNRISEVDEKQKLKEILKEMKDSLPKRPKHDKNELDKNKTKLSALQRHDENLLNTDTATLQIGFSIQNKAETVHEPRTSNVKITDTPNIKKVITYMKPHCIPENILATQTVITDSQLKDKSYIDKKPLHSISSANKVLHKETQSDVTNRLEIKYDINKHLNINSSKEIDLQTPLKISSLLNPVYIPKKTTLVPEAPNIRLTSQAELGSAHPESQIESCTKSVKPVKEEVPSASFFALSSPSTSQLDSSCAKTPLPKNEDITQNIEKQQLPIRNSPMKSQQMPRTSLPVGSQILNENEKSVNEYNSNNVIQDKLSSNQHAKRRDLINQLEQSIAKGNERAAAEAAVKLAQLRLSCSVLSFSSQIVREDHSTPLPSTDSDKKKVLLKNDTINSEESLPKSNKVNTALQSTSEFSPNKKKVIENNNDKIFPSTSKVQESSTSNSVEINKLSNKNKYEMATKATIKEPKLDHDVNGNNMVTINVWVEDKEAARGPVRLRISREAPIRELRRQAEISLGLVARLQRWIIGHTLCTDDNTPLVSLAGPDLSAPFYLCLVETDVNTGKTSSLKSKETEKKVKSDGEAGDVYSQLVQLEQQALVPNAEAFECEVCMERCAVGEGAVLRECVHAFCKTCLSDVVRHCEEPAVSCPAMGCPGLLQEREIRGLVTPEEYERWLAHGLAAAESGTRNSFHCRTRDCTGWALCEPGVRKFPCPVCKHINCVPCQAIHEGVTCEQHSVKLQQEVAATTEASQTDEGTRVLLKSLISRGEALECPECNAIITKKWGCDWVKCFACKTEICWVTRGRRWGPGGRGDTSAGCRCGVDGQRCHPSCGYCH